MAVFLTNCATCRGDQGAGDGPAATALPPMPANLSEAAVQDRSDWELLAIIADGVAGTAMPPWGSILSEQERSEILDFIRSLATQ